MAKPKATGTAKAAAKAKPAVKASARTKADVKAAAKAKPAVKPPAKARAVVKAAAKAKPVVKPPARSKADVKAAAKTKSPVKAAAKASAKAKTTAKATAVTKVAVTVKAAPRAKSASEARGVLTVGVIGLGHMGAGFHAEYLARARKFQLTAVCDPDEAVLARAKRRLKVATYTSINDFLIQGGAEVVVVASPTVFHAEQAVTALRAGRHVVVETPMCMSVHEADMMISASRQYQRTLAVFHSRRWDSDFLTARKTLQSEKLGAVFAVQRRSYVPGSVWAAADDAKRPWRLSRASGGGIGLDLGCHLIDQVLQLVASEPEVVFGDAQARELANEVDDHFTCLLRFRNRALAVIEATACARTPAVPWIIIGTKGSLQGDERKLRGKVGSDTRLKDFAPNMIPGDPEDFYDNLHKAITSGDDLAVTAAQARQVVLILEAAYRSSRIGCAVRLTGFE